MVAVGRAAVHPSLPLCVRLPLAALLLAQVRRMMLIVRVKQPVILICARGLTRDRKELQRGQAGRSTCCRRRQQTEGRSATLYREQKLQGGVLWLEEEWERSGS